MSEIEIAWKNAWGQNHSVSQEARFAGWQGGQWEGGEEGGAKSVEDLEIDKRYAAVGDEDPDPAKERKAGP